MKHWITHRHTWAPQTIWAFSQTGKETNWVWSSIALAQIHIRAQCWWICMARAAAEMMSLLIVYLTSDVIFLLIAKFSGMFTAKAFCHGGDDATDLFLAFYSFHLINVGLFEGGAASVRRSVSLAWEYLRCLIFMWSMHVCTSYFTDWWVNGKSGHGVHLTLG